MLHRDRSHRDTCANPKIIVPHGGYTTALLCRAAQTHFINTHAGRHDSLPRPIGLQLVFPQPTVVGTARIVIEDIKIGKRTSTIHISLLQLSEKGSNQGDYVVKITGYITLSPPTAEKGVSAPTSWVLHPNVPPGSLPGGKVDLERLGREGHDGIWSRVEIPLLQFRRASAHTELFSPNPVQSDPQRRGVVDAWVRFRPIVADSKAQLGRWTNVTLGYLCDMSLMVLLGLVGGLDLSSSNAKKPAESESITQREKLAMFWYPTVSLNIDFKKQLPDEGVEWLYMRLHIKSLQDGRTDLNVEILDVAGEVIALSNQIGLVMGSGRNSGEQAIKAEQPAKSKI